MTLIIVYASLFLGQVRLVRSPHYDNLNLEGFVMRPFRNGSYSRNVERSVGLRSRYQRHIVTRCLCYLTVFVSSFRIIKCAFDTLDLLTDEEQEQRSRRLYNLLDIGVISWAAAAWLLSVIIWDHNSYAFLQRLLVCGSSRSIGGLRATKIGHESRTTRACR